MPPPSPASRGPDGKPLGGSTVDETGMHHHVRNPTEAKAERDAAIGRNNEHATRFLHHALHRGVGIHPVHDRDRIIHMFVRAVTGFGVALALLR